MNAESPSGGNGRMASRRRKVLGRWLALGDVLIVAAVVTLSAFLITWSVAGERDGSDLRAVVSVNGKEVEAVPLRGGAHELTVRGFQGESHVEVRDGRVRMEDSACPDKLCVKTGWISKPGQGIVCLPNRVVVEVKGGEGGPDAVNR